MEPTREVSLTEKEKAALKVLAQYVSWPVVSPGLSNQVCGSLCRKGFAEKMIHSEHVHHEKRVSWTIYRASESGRLMALTLS